MEGNSLPQFMIKDMLSISIIERYEDYRERS